MPELKEARTVPVAEGLEGPARGVSPQLLNCTRCLGGRTEPASLSLADSSYPLLNEDLAPLNSILTSLGMVVGYQPEPNVHPCPMPAGVIGIAPRVDEAGPFLELAVRLCYPHGQCRGYLGIVSGPDDAIARFERALQASLALAARTIHERWFRLNHRNRWIVAAAPLAAPDQAVLIALDQRLVVQGLDMQGLDFPSPGLNATAQVRWDDLFRQVTPLPTLRARADLPLRLFSALDGLEWTAILTGPDLISGESSRNALFHARPRMHGLADLLKRDPEQSAHIPSLTPGMRRKIEDYVEANLDAQLPVERLADAAGMSCSHFTRAFRNVLKMTPHRYVMWRRLMRAQELIRSCDASLAEVAMLTGFSDQSHLCRLFQLHMGETPSRFRRRCR